MITGGSLNLTGGEPLKLTEDHILSVLFVRRARSRIFGKNLFSDPAWDIILELYAANLSGKALSLTGLAQAIEAPVSTTARWAASLTGHGIIETTSGTVTAGPTLKLTSEGTAKMEQLASQWASAFVSI